MTRFEELNTMDIEALAEWLDKHGQYDGSPWCEWFDDTYCKNCESIMCHYEDSEHEFPCGWCEVNDKCKFFPNMDDVPNSKEIVKMWLESDLDGKDINCQD